MALIVLVSGPEVIRRDGCDLLSDRMRISGVGWCGRVATEKLLVGGGLRRAVIQQMLLSLVLLISDT